MRERKKSLAQKVRRKRDILDHGTLLCSQHSQGLCATCKTSYTLLVKLTRTRKNVGKMREMRSV